MLSGGKKSASHFDENCEALTNNCKGRLQTAEGSDSNAGCMLEFFFFFSMLDGSWKWSQPNVHKLIFKRRDQISMGPRTFTQSEIDPIQNPNSSKPRENTNTESSDGWKEQQHTVIFLCTAQVKLSVTLFECLCKSTLLLIVNVTIL